MRGREGGSRKCVPDWSGVSFEAVDERIPFSTDIPNVQFLLTLEEGGEKETEV